jgi:hypothetical protein
VRAASISTTSGTSLNGRYISLGRWNEPLMVSGTATDFTPDVNGSLLAPDWILVSRSGSNPTTFSGNLTYSSTNSSSVVGRYAYNIYNEGGLLDMNVAGYPTATGTFPSAFNYKDALAMADLTQLTDSSGNQVLTQQQINQIVGWRNYGTLQPTGSFPNLALLTSATANALYASFITGNANGFMRTSGTSLFNSQSNHLFGSRQELIKFLLHGIGTSTTRPELQKALQYMSTFNRSLNEPSYYPDPTRPMVVGPAATTSNSAVQLYTGGNSAYQQDNIYNPEFKSIQISTPFTRADGSSAVVGEPLG